VGNGAVIAQATGIPTVADFRSADIAVGGEGAPLVPIYDYVVLRSGTKSRVALNIGGIANLTAIPRGAQPAAVLSFDTGPGNCVLDLAAGRLTHGKLRYDRGGAMARGGNLDSRRLRQMLAHPYFTRKPPKSTGWEEFGEDFTGRLLAKMKPGRRGRSADVMRTLTEVVAESIARAVQDFVAPAMRPDEVVVTGGGSRNTFLVDCLRERLTARFPAIVVEPGEAFGINSAAKEACAFAYLAYLCLRGIPANLASQAAGLRPAVLGAVYPGYPGSGLQTCKVPDGPRATADRSHPAT
jgi:anhydro-N-acetylmuramic acid kinase